MSIYQFKPAFQNLLRPACRFLAAQGVTPNQITILALFLSLATGATIWLSSAAPWTLALVPLVLFARMALNAIDGMLAREHDMKTPLGAILNELGDVLSDTALYLPLAILPGIESHILILVVVLAIISEMAGVLPFQIGGQRRYDGPMGKSDRAFVFGIISLLIAAGIPAGAWVSFTLGLTMVLLIVTVAKRVRGALEEAL